MKYWKYANIFCMLVIILLLGANVVWANDASHCEQFYAQKQYKLAISACKVESIHGLTRAQFYLGEMYFSGNGVNKDYTKAAKWLRKAAEKGYVLAQYELATMLDNGNGIKKDSIRSAKWFQKAAIQGFAPAQYNLGNKYYSGKGVKKNDEYAVIWLRKAAEQGFTSAAVVYSNGDLSIRSGAASADWYYKSGVSYLKLGNKDNALRSVERIKELRDKFHLSVPNMFLADQLLKLIYGEGPKPDKKHNPKTGNNTVSFGTGWAVSRSHIVTNYHVVAGYRKITLLRTDGREIPATVVTYDAVNDLALLKIKSSINMPKSLQLASKPARIGDKVFTIGYPHPTTMGAKPKLTDGVISATSGLNDDPRIYQISVPLQSGNSGGPL